MTGTVLGSVKGDNDHVPLASQTVQLAGHDGGHHLPHAVEHGQARGSHIGATDLYLLNDCVQHLKARRTERTSGQILKHFKITKAEMPCWESLGREPTPLEHWQASRQIRSWELRTFVVGGSQRGWSPPWACTACMFFCVGQHSTSQQSSNAGNLEIRQ